MSRGAPPLHNRERTPPYSTEKGKKLLTNQQIHVVSVIFLLANTIMLFTHYKAVVNQQEKNGFNYQTVSITLFNKEGEKAYLSGDQMLALLLDDDKMFETFASIEHNCGGKLYKPVEYGDADTTEDDATI